MSKVSVTYHVPLGESKVCEAFGHTFFDGKAVEIEDTPANKNAIAKLRGNKCFEVSGEGGTAYVKPTAEEAKAKAEAEKAEKAEAEDEAPHRRGGR